MRYTHFAALAAIILRKVNNVPFVYRRIRWWSALATTLALLLLEDFSLTSEAGVPRRPLAAEDLYSVETLSDPQVSPDGQWVAYVVTLNDRLSDEPVSSIWVSSWDGSRRRKLTKSTNDSAMPRWSPNGHNLAFVATPPGHDKRQIMMLHWGGGDARAVTDVRGDIGEYAWSPNSNRFVFAMEQFEEVPHAVSRNAQSSVSPIVIRDVKFKEDQIGYIAAGRERHLYLVDVRSRRLEALTTGSQFNEDMPVWCPDGSRVAFVRSRGRGPDEDGGTDIVTIEPKPGATALTITRRNSPNLQKLEWSPDGSLIAYLQGAENKYRGYNQDHLFVVAAAGGQPRPLTEKLDRAIMAYTFDADSKAIEITVEDDRNVYPARVDVASATITRVVAQAPAVVSGLSTRAGHTALLKSSDDAPGELYALERGRLRKLTSHNDQWLSHVQLGAVEDVQFKSKDGTDVHGLIVKPPTYAPGQKYPLVLWIHGGPNTQDEHAFNLDGYRFAHQMFAAAGFVVLGVNYRGSGGRGAAYARAIFADWGHKEVDDLLSGADYGVARAIAEPSKLFIGGWSYGGILTDYTIARDGRFKAAISGAGSANPLVMYGSDQFVYEYNQELGPPWENTASWLRLAYPFLHADRIHTPTLFMAGARDFDVPIAGSEQMYQALRTLGVPTELVIYPDQYHVITRPSFVVDLIQRMTGWWARYSPSARSR